MSITEDYVSFETAKLLKEKGFNEKCRGCYHCGFDDNDNSIVMLEEWTAQPYNNNFVDEGFLCSAPTLQMARKWLEKIHGIHLNIIYNRICDKGYWGKGHWTWNNTEYNSYENALEAAIKYCLENLI